MGSHAKKKYAIVPLMKENSETGAHYYENECVMKCTLINQQFFLSRFVEVNEGRCLGRAL